MFRGIIVSLFVALFCAAAPAGIITQWNFNSVPPDGDVFTGTTMPSIGSGIFTTQGITTPTYVSSTSHGGSSDPQDNDRSAFMLTGFPVQGTANKTAGIVFSISTVGYDSIAVEWDQNHLVYSANTARLQYAVNVNAPVWIDSSQFTFTPTETTANFWYTHRSVDLSSIAGLNNNPNAAFRIVAEFAPATSGYLSSRTTVEYDPAMAVWRFDMLTITGTPIPEPTVFAWLAVLGIGIKRRRRRLLPSIAIDPSH